MSERKPQGRILVIDDQEPTRYIFRRILNRAGFEVQEAGTGQHGLEKAALQPDLIIADINLPDMLGFDLTRRIKSNPLTCDIPVLQISASMISDESKVQALDGGADSYLTQPVEPAVLLASVNALLRLRKAEELSHYSALQWQRTFDSLSDGLALTDAQGVVVRTNGRFLRMLSVPASDVEGRQLATVIKERFGLGFEELRKQLRAGRPPELTLDNRWFRVRYDTVHAEQEAVTGSVLILTDVTDQKKLQETLKLSERLAATGRIAHIIAHEINNPLEAMSNLLYLAEQDTTGRPETQAYIRQASSELVRISQITRQVLAYHRDAKRPMLTRANEIIEGVLTMFRAHMIGMGVQLKTQLRCDTELLVNAGEVRQVFSNLISNSLDAMKSAPGKLRVRCFTARDQRSGASGVRFVFSDDGCGIPAIIVPHVFEAFYTTKDTKGSGVGLWLSSEVVARHGGSIRIRTRTGGPYRGTLFAIFLPCTPVE